MCWHWHWCPADQEVFSAHTPPPPPPPPPHPPFPSSPRTAPGKLDSGHLNLSQELSYQWSDDEFTVATSPVMLSQLQLNTRKPLWTLPRGGPFPQSTVATCHISFLPLSPSQIKQSDHSWFIFLLWLIEDSLLVWYKYRLVFNISLYNLNTNMN